MNNNQHLPCDIGAIMKRYPDACPEEAAARAFVSRRDRQSHPDGTFDKAKRWYPDGDERQNCCEHIRSPSRHFPLSTMKHCRTLPHICEVLDVRADEVRSYLQQVDPRVEERRHLTEKKRQAQIGKLRTLLATRLYDVGMLDALMEMTVVRIKSLPMLAAMLEGEVEKVLEQLLVRTKDEKLVRNIQVYLRLTQEAIPMAA